MDDFIDAERSYGSRASGESDRDSDEIRLRDVSNTIVSKAPRGRFKLGYFAVICMTINNMIGTGIFNTPSTLMQGTRSVGISLLFWFAGAIYSVAGVYILSEFGLNTPRYVFENEEIGVPRSGGMLNYLQYVFPWPAYRDRTVLLSGVVFGITYIILANTASNSVVFAVRVLQAANIPAEQQSKSVVYGIAISTVTFACLTHGVSRRGGIWLSNLLATIKILMLLVVICAGFASVGGAFSVEANPENLSTSNSFDGVADDSYGYAQAFLAIIFAYTGFDNPTTVLGEISQPHKKFPRATGIAVALVSVLYILVNISFMMVVPRLDMIQPGFDIASAFFKQTFGSLTPDDNSSQRLLAAFMAISSLGNIIAVTFSSARVKQEIAKEGFIPFAKFFGQSRDWSLGRLLKWARGKPSLPRPVKRVLESKALEPSNHSQETPVGALLLLWAFSLIMLVVTVGQHTYDAYGVLVSVFAYCVQAFFNLVLSIGLLYMRLSPRSSWSSKAKGFIPALSITAGFLYGLGNLFPIVALWVPPSGEYARTTIATIQWYVTPTTCVSVLGFAIIWWLSFVAVARYLERKNGTVFTVEKVPDLRRDPPGGDVVQIHESVFLSWTAKETLGSDYEVPTTSVSFSEK